MVCNRCQKRPAIIFVQRMENGQMKNEGFCLHCARELHIKPVEDLMKQFGMSDEDMDNMENRMESMMDEMGDANPLSLMMNMGQPMDGEENEGDDDLVPGSSATFPLGVKAEGDAGNSKKAQKNGKKPPQVSGYLLREPDPQSPGGQARRHRGPRPRDLPHHPDLEPPPEEQPLPHR